MFDQLKNDWKNQKGTNLATIDEMKAAINKSEKGLRRSLLNAAMLLCFTVLVLIGIWVFIPFEKSITVMALFFICAVILAATLYMGYIHNIMPKLTNDMQATDKYIQEWIDYQESTKRTTNWFMPFYNLSIVIGIMIYMQEITEGNRMFFWVATASVIIWMLYVWFYLTPKMKKKNEAKIDKIIEDCKTIQAQLKA